MKSLPSAKRLPAAAPVSVSPLLPASSAFGIPGKEIGFTAIKHDLERYQAFLGWREVTTAGVPDAQSASQKGTTLAFSYALWMSKVFTLEECYRACMRKGRPASRYEDVAGSVNIEFPLGALRLIPANPGEEGNILEMPENKRIYGYPRITRPGAVP